MENDKVIEIMQNCLTYGGSCASCPFASIEIYDGDDTCTYKMMMAALTVLKEQKKEIERLSKIIEL